MFCPKCQSDEMKVIDTRHQEECVYRRRRCVRCSHRWTTYEVCEKGSFTDGIVAVVNLKKFKTVASKISQEIFDTLMATVEVTSKSEEQGED